MSRGDKTAVPRLLYLVHSLDPGGAERLAVDMASALAGEFEFVFACLDAPGRWAPGVRASGAPVHCLWRQPGVDLRLARPLARLVREQRVDLVHAHQYTPWFYAGLARGLKRAPRLLFEEHGRLYPEIRSRRRELFNRLVLLPRTDRVVAVSSDLKRRLAAYEGIDPSRVGVIHNGIEPLDPPSPEERAALREELDLAPSDFVVGTVGRFDPVKNLPLLLEAIHLARRSAPRMRALLVGDGPSAAEVRETVERLGLEEVVRLPGYRADAARLVGALDLFVLSSSSEGTSLALLEAMAAAVPAMVTDVGGNPEVVEDGDSGWVLPAADAQALSAGLQRAAGLPAECARRGAAARKRVESRFLFSTMIARYRTIYRELLGGPD